MWGWGGVLCSSDGPRTQWIETVQLSQQFTVRTGHSCLCRLRSKETEISHAGGQPSPQLIARPLVVLVLILFFVFVFVLHAAEVTPLPGSPSVSEKVVDNVVNVFP